MPFECSKIMCLTVLQSRQDSACCRFVDVVRSLRTVCADGLCDRVSIFFCTHESRMDSATGYIQTLIALRVWRKRQLGLALLLHAFDTFKCRGKVRAAFHWDVQSLTSATRLYTDASMDVDQLNHEYQLDPRSGIDLTASLQANRGIKRTYRSGGSLCDCNFIESRASASTRGTPISIASMSEIVATQSLAMLNSHLDAEHWLRYVCSRRFRSLA